MEYLLTVQVTFKSFDDCTARMFAQKVQKSFQEQPCLYAEEGREVEFKLREVHQGKAPRTVNL